MDQYDSYTDDDEKLCQIFVNITRDNKNCYYCMKEHFGENSFDAYMGKKFMLKERNRILTRTRTAFNTLSIISSLTTFIVFGGPKSIYFLSFCSACLVFASLHVEKYADLVIFELCAIFLSLIVFMKCAYAIHVAIIINERKKQH
jgi:hypothetical protein